MGLIIHKPTGVSAELYRIAIRKMADVLVKTIYASVLIKNGEGVHFQEGIATKDQRYNFNLIDDVKDEHNAFFSFVPRIFDYQYPYEYEHTTLFRFDSSINEIHYHHRGPNFVLMANYPHSIFRDNKTSNYQHMVSYMTKYYSNDRMITAVTNCDFKRVFDHSPGLNHMNEIVIGDQYSQFVLNKETYVDVEGLLVSSAFLANVIKKTLLKRHHAIKKPALRISAHEYFKYRAEIHPRIQDLYFRKKVPKIGSFNLDERFVVIKYSGHEKQLRIRSLSDNRERNAYFYDLYKDFEPYVFNKLNNGNSKKIK